MKVEIVGALLHRPQVLFLDEPTIGLDVTMQKRIRAFVAEYNRRFGATVLLTSHYMADVQALCRRVIVIHHGRILFDGGLAELATRFNATKTIGVMLKEGTADLSAYGEVIATDDEKVTLRVVAGRRAGGHDAPAARPAGRRPHDRGPADRGRHRARLRRRRPGGRADASRNGPASEVAVG